ncbi:hypothetical protein AN960_14985 [Bacillus sp. FJAT-25509]|uniref:hypothetical protein n=1 Tax=Bacillus sp. FJAT-25509 TaxID=1712029 RepID=UPI0006F8B23E|nr:hypothetical protein [Bacillus sp. FJAT-25509]KQL38247.1 hypothetical protein AN960_14985 [Bacillus sp. FJAT-25509]
MFKKKNLFKIFVIFSICLIIFYFYQNQKSNKVVEPIQGLVKNNDIKKEFDNNNTTISSKDTKLQSNNISINKNDNNKVISSALLFGDFDSTNALIKDSNLVVKGTVIATEPYVYLDEESHGTPYTKLTFKIRNVLSGDKKMNGKTITILEYGGEISKKDFGLDKKFNNLTELELQEKLEISLEGISNSKVGQSIVAFLTDDKDTIGTGFKFYSFRGEYKGRFTYDQRTKKYKRGEPYQVSNKEREKELEINNDVSDLSDDLEG